MPPQEWRQGYDLELRSMCETELEMGFLRSLFKVHQESRLETAGTGDKYTYSIAGESKEGSDELKWTNMQSRCAWTLQMRAVKDTAVGLRSTCAHRALTC